MHRFLLIIIFIFQVAHASIINLGDKLVNEEQQRKNQKELFSTPKQAEFSEDKSSALFRPFSGCLRINNINIIDNKLNGNSSGNLLINGCVNSQELNNLLIKLNSSLFKQGYITARLEIENYIKSTKKLIIKIRRGYIEKLATTAINRCTAFPGLTEKELRIQDIDQGLAQLNRLPSQHSIVTLWPGKEVGYTIIKVTTKKIGKPYRLYLSFDNTGNKLTGKNIWKINFSYDDLLSLNDQLFFAGSRSGLGRNRSMAFTWKEEIPFGYYTFWYDGSYSYSQYDIYPEVKETELALNNFKNKINFSRIFYKNLYNNISLNTSFLHYIPQQEIAGIQLKSLEQKISAFEIGVQYDYYQSRFKILNELNYTQGLRLFGATKNFRNSHANFRRYKLTSDYLWKIVNKMYLNGNIKIQYAEQSLPGVAKLSVLDEINLALDEGIGIGHELIFPTFFSSMFNPFLYENICWAKDKNSNSEKYSATGVGIKLNYLGFNARGTISKITRRDGWVVLFELSQKIL